MEFCNEIDNWSERLPGGVIMRQGLADFETGRLHGSGRLQTVHRETNPLFHLLISTFYFQTGVPLVLNTSFNENEPVVCRPDEALDCFLRTRMDLLVMGEIIVTRAV